MRNQSRNKSNIINVLLAAAAILTPTSSFAAAAAAAAAPAGSVLDYPESFFAGAQLSTAYDMVRRLPGFMFDDGSDARGFAGTAGNVLIDGARPTSKTDDLTSVLQRIPVSRIADVQVIRGGAPGIDMQGQAVVANVILKQDETTSVVATLNNVLYGDGHSAPGGSVEFRTRAGANVYEATVTRYNDVWDDGGGDGHYVFTTPGGPTQTGSLTRRGAERDGWGINASATLPLLGGEFGANLTARRTIYNSRITYGAPETAFYFDGEKTLPIETGLHWDGHFGATELNLVALQRLEHDESVNTGDDSGGAQLFVETRHTSESILRGTLRYNWTPSLTLESGLEGAYNSLNGTSSYTLNGAAIALPAADARVGERRGEAFVQGSWKILPDLSLEAGVRGEMSRISAFGVPSRSFAFAKPRLLISWSPLPDHQFRIRAERVVGQLDFTNFIASSDLSGVGVSAGNLNLRPDSRYQYEAVYEYHFWDKGAFVASYMREDISDLVDYIPIGGGLDGPGNIPKAKNDEVKLNLILPLDRLGDAGGQFKAAAQWDDSSVNDPVTGLGRPISSQQDHKYTFHFIQDMPGWNSSVDLAVQPGGFNRPAYRIDQIQTVRLLTTYLEVVWDYKPTPDLDITIEADNFIPYRLGIEQDNYSGPRNIAPLSQVQDFTNITEPRLFVQLRKTF